MFKLFVGVHNVEITQLDIPGYETVIRGEDPAAGLLCFIAVHSTTLGPAMGGTRIYPYTSEQDALTDVLRLSKAMTYKSAICEDGLGGGKSVIIADAATQKNEKLLMAFGEVLDTLHGKYIAAEDVGTTTEDMVVIRRVTPYVAALPSEKSSGDPSRFTAWGVFKGIQAVAKSLWGSPSIRRRTIAIQGLGNVGSKLANILFWEGANLILSDIHIHKAEEIAHLYGAQVVPNDAFFLTPCDIMAPCALGGVLNDQTIPTLKCQAIAGAANNQLLEPRHGDELHRRKILYMPDYVINAGGIINAAIEFDPEGYNPKTARDKVNHIFDTCGAIIELCRQENKPTSVVADEMAEYKLQNGIGKRARPILFTKR
jgi:leucine dehydrogenase